MVCDLCKKNNAVIHIEKHSGENHSQMRICCECAGLEGLTPENLTGETLQKLISGINLFQQGSSETVCLDCGMTADSFRESGRLGCSSCFVYLKSVLDLTMWQKTPHFKHVGKTPFKFQAQAIEGKVVMPVEDLEMLEAKLFVCISEERFEDAAILRDRIVEVKKAVS